MSCINFECVDTCIKKHIFMQFGLLNYYLHYEFNYKGSKRHTYCKVVFIHFGVELPFKTVMIKKDTTEC